MVKKKAIQKKGYFYVHGNEYTYLSMDKQTATKKYGQLETKRLINAMRGIRRPKGKLVKM